MRHLRQERAKILRLLRIEMQQKTGAAHCFELLRQHRLIFNARLQPRHAFINQNELARL